MKDNETVNANPPEENAAEAPPNNPEAEPKGETASDEAATRDSGEKLAALESEREELLDQLLRARAEFDNYRKRIAREQERVRQHAAEQLLHDLLPILDNIDLALRYKDEDSKSLAEGVSMVAKQLQDVTKRHGLETIPAAGENFDPNIHEAVAQVPSDAVPPDGVVEEYQRGYLLGGKVLRPAKVTVSAGPAEESAQTENNQ